MDRHQNPRPSGHARWVAWLRNEADEPASILMLFTPGVPREAYFEGLAGLANMTDEQRREFVIGHDNYYV